MMLTFVPASLPSLGWLLLPVSSWLHFGPSWLLPPLDEEHG